MSDEASRIAKLESEVQHNEEEIKELKAELKAAKTIVYAIKSQQDQWKGGVGVLVFFCGALAGGVVAIVTQFWSGPK